MKHSKEQLADTLLETVDWKGISIDDINQISHEVRHWYGDYRQLQEFKKVLGEDIGDSFEDKFNNWIGDRIQMVLDRSL